MTQPLDDTPQIVSLSARLKETLAEIERVERRAGTSQEPETRTWRQRVIDAFTWLDPDEMDEEQPLWDRPEWRHR